MPGDSSRFSAPVALIIFNRPEKTARVFEAIRRAQPRKLFIIADGSRTPEEEARCAATRAIVDTIDWECEVFRNYSESNLGCKTRVSSGISWVFESVDRAVFLEDDCLPHPDFFPFCDELLERYKDDTRIMHISGDNFQQKNKNFLCDKSYYFSVIPHVWGWATWKRAWEFYDPDISNWPEIQKSGVLKDMLPDPAVRERWELLFDRYYRHTIDSWDGQWACACLVNHGISINPCVNLVTNIGFDSEATHSQKLDTLQTNLPVEELRFPLVHPVSIELNIQADTYTEKYIFSINRYAGQKLRWFFRSRFPRAYSNMKKFLGRASIS